MPVNYEVKSQLAKLLATEDLVVEHKKVATAQFNVETRVLTLPMWKRASNSVYDMLVGHEVGHALFTPDDWSWEGTVPQQFVNVTEDARIEKLMKRKYPGLFKSFNAGYKELARDDFFCIEDENVDDMNLADRANLYFKIGDYVDIPLYDDEMDIIKQIGDAETFEDAVAAAKALYAYCKKPKQESQPMIQPPQTGGAEGGEQQEQQQQTPPPEASGDSEEERPDLGPDETKYEELIEEEIVENAEPQVQTDQTFEERVEEFNGNLEAGQENEYIEVPDFELDKIIVPFSEIRQKFDWAEDLYSKSEDEVYKWVDHQYAEFKKSAQKEVNYLVKEFECRKSADAYARAATSRTGVLDCTKLHTYKYNEDLFKKVTILPDGKNHGLIFILDWSGSMADSIVSTIKQLFNLIWFCNKCNIPFDVYAFTTTYVRDADEERTPHVWEEGKFILSGDFKLMNFLTSRVKKKELEKQMLSLFRLANNFRSYGAYNYPAEFGLSGTPLNESIIALHKIIPAFKKMHGLQKVNCFILTDGEANSLMMAREGAYGGRGCKHVYAGTSYLRNRKTGHTYMFSHEYYQFTQVLLENLKEENKDCNFIGIRLCGGREFSSFIKRYEWIADSDMKKIQKQKYYDIKGTGYTSYFAMMTSALNNDADFEVEEGASKAKIKSAFVKNLKTKALNKIVLGKFMELVA